MTVLQKFIRCAVLAVLVSIAAVSAVQAQTAASMQREGIRKAREGDPQTGAEMLEQCIEQYPDYRNLDYVMYNLGDIYENQLFKFDRARNVYEELVDRFPSSRWAQRGRIRLNKLHVSDSDLEAAPVAELKSIRRNYRHLGSEKVIESYLLLLTEYPTFSRRDEVLFGLAQELELRAMPDEDFDGYNESLKYYESLIREHPTSDMAFVSIKQSGDLLLEMRRYEEAKAVYMKMADYPERDGVRAAEDHLAEVDKQRSMLHVYYAALALIVALVGYQLLAIKYRNLNRAIVARAMIEPGLMILASIAGCAALLMLQKPNRYLLIVIMLGLGYAATTFCNSLYISSNRLHAITTAIQTVVVLSLSAAVTYSVFFGFNLIPIVVQTLKANYYIFRLGG